MCRLAVGWVLDFDIDIFENEGVGWGWGWIVVAALTRMTSCGS